MQRIQYEFYSSLNQKIIDALIVGVSFHLAYEIRFDWHIPTYHTYQFWLLLPGVMLGRVFVSSVLGTYRLIWRYICLADAITVSRDYCAFTLILLALRFGVPTSLAILQVPLSIIIIELLLSVEGVLSVRALRRLLHEGFPAKMLNGNSGSRALLIGAGRTGVLVAKELASRGDLRPVGFLDDDPKKMGTVINGLRVFGPLSCLQSVVREYGIQQVIICIPQLPRDAFKRVWALGEELSVSVRIMPPLKEILEGKVTDKRNLLLIGGGGYIGSALLPKLLDRGYHVRLLDLFLYGEDPIIGVKDHPNLEIMRADFRQVDSVVEAMEGRSTVIHLGAIVGDPACALNEQLTIETNLVATRFIAEVAKGQGISRFIFASTCSVYGASDELLNEHSALNPVSLYARSKIASERVLMELRDDKFQPVILRFGTIYGVSGRTRFDLVVNLLTAKAMSEGKITVLGPGQWRPFIHVDDAATAVLAATEARPELLSDGIFNVGADEQNATLGDVGKLIKSLVPTAELIISNSDGDRRNYRVDFSRIRNLLGFTPKWTLEAGVRHMMEAIASARVVDYRDPKYSNAKFLSEQGAEVLRARGDWVQPLLSAERMREPVVPGPGCTRPPAAQPEVVPISGMLASNPRARAVPEEQQKLA